MRWDDVVKWLAGIAGALAGLLGEWNVFLTVLAIMMVLDYVTGLIVAWRGKSPKSETGGVSSKVGFDGLIKKAFIMVVVLVATLLDTAIGNATHVFQMAAVMYYIANEGISILENTALMGVQYPKFVIKALETMREKNDGDAGTSADETGISADDLSISADETSNIDNDSGNSDNDSDNSADETGENIVVLNRRVVRRKDKPPGDGDETE